MLDLSSTTNSNLPQTAVHGSRADFQPGVDARKLEFVAGSSMLLPSALPGVTVAVYVEYFYKKKVNFTQ